MAHHCTLVLHVRVIICPLSLPVSLLLPFEFMIFIGPSSIGCNASHCDSVVVVLSVLLNCSLMN